MRNNSRSKHDGSPLDVEVRDDDGERQQPRDHSQHHEGQSNDAELEEKWFEIFEKTLLKEILLLSLDEKLLNYPELIRFKLI